MVRVIDACHDEVDAMCRIDVHTWKTTGSCVSALKQAGYQIAV